MATRLPNATRSAMANAAVDRLDAGSGDGYIEIRSGSQPADPDDAATGTVLATIPLPATAFGNATDGVATANAISEATGEAAGTAGWFRAYDSDDNSVLDGSAGTSGTDMILNTATISVGVAVQVTAWTFTQPAA